jgi:2-oxoisovalerate ferredoxin oxidoreductase beta subunit
MSVFYDKFTRHADGVGLKGNSTHYCPGCGHGLVHKFLAEAIEELGIQGNTILVSPVGCSVFAYYYFDVGNTQAAHGRAPAVALGHKLTNPEANVISYQGDGDLASIGLAETVSAAQLGAPITVIFINNAIYGMTGGQMAPTTLMGQSTATCPDGRSLYNGQPMRMAELIAGLEGPVYVDRVALFDAKNRRLAKKAIRKAVECQVTGKGYAFVEVLSECPTHLRMDPEKAQAWVKDKMVPIFPLGVKKDVVGESWWKLPKPDFTTEHMLKAVGASQDGTEKHCKAFPAHINPLDISLKLAGSGGDGAQTAAMLIARAAINEGFDATHIPSYGPESRGGTSYADVHVAKDEVLNPASPRPDIFIAFNAPSLAKFGATVRKGGTIVYDSSIIKEVPAGIDPSVKVVGAPFTEIAADLGKVLVKNIVALGALHAATNLFPKETLLAAVRQALKDKCALIPLNEQAFAWGVKAVEEQGK